MNEWIKSSDARELRQRIDWHLANIQSDQDLRNRLEGMASTSLFRALGWFWAPKLYARNRAMFRPFIQQHLAEHYVPVENRARWERIEYAGEVAASLDAWLAILQKDLEVALFRRIYAWKHRQKNNWTIDEATWQADLLRAFEGASPANRAKVLELYQQHAMLDERGAIRLYEIDRQTASAFILKHLPRAGWFQRKVTQQARWKDLEAVALKAGDEGFVWKLYRNQVDVDEWIADALALCRRIADPEQLNQALEQRHPERVFGGLGQHFYKLMEARGLDVLPYVRRHLKRVHSFFGSDGFKDMAALARKNQWIDFWSALVVTCGKPADYNVAIAELIEDRQLQESERRRRLLMLSGVSREWNYLGWGLARVQMLKAANALALYRRYPDLLKQAFKAHVTPTWTEDHVDLFDEAWRNGDEELADYLASRYVTRAYLRKTNKAVEAATEKYLSLKISEEAFARRAANVLTLVPAYTIFRYDALIKDNRLARLLFERSLSSFLADPAAVRDLVEGSEIHVQMLSYRVLALRDPRAEEQARDNLDILIGTLLRPLHRRTRLAAFGALRNAATSEDCAQRVLAKCKEAFALPDEHYPKEALVGLIADLLVRYPTLASAEERPVIYRRVA